MTITLRTVGVALLTAALLLTLVGSGGVSSATIDRGATVGVASDADAVVGYDSPETVTVNGSEERTLVTITNRHPAGVSITAVDVESPADLDVSVTHPAGAIGAGEAGAIRAQIDCAQPVERAELQLTVRIDGDGLSATIFGDVESRTVSVTCEPGVDDPTA